MKLSLGALAVLACLLALTACGGSGSKPNASPTSTPTTNAATDYYVSIGDSYAAGYQPTNAGNTAGTTRNGFAYQVASRLTGVTLVNFGCSGATSTSVSTTAGCEAAALGPDAPSYSGQTQEAAAAAFLAAHPGHIKLVTVILGGNDVTNCGTPSEQSAWTNCITSALKTLTVRLNAIVGLIRTSTGADTPIIGLTYPDVLLAQYLKGTAASAAVAEQSVTFFKDTLNPMLSKIYAAHDATFVDITAATGAYGSAAAKTSYGDLGELPTPVAKVCQLTFICDASDVHPKTVGYTLIADAVLKAYNR